MQKKIEYNQKSAQSIGWLPSWFDASSHDIDLIEKIKRYQNQNDLSPDGLIGPKTYLSIYKKREKEKFPSPTVKGRNYLIFCGNRIPIEWEKVQNYIEYPKWRAPSGDYTSRLGHPVRDIKYVVNHWDATLSSTHCYRILRGRSLSSQLLVDNNGEVIVTTDLNNICWHAGGAKWNRESIGIEVSNAYYLKYQKHYQKHLNKSRPIEGGYTLHGVKQPDHLGFFPVQLEALRAIYSALHKHLNIPLLTPKVKGVHPPTQKGEFRGLVHHYHLLRSKIDAGNYDIQKQINLM